MVIEGVVRGRGGEHMWTKTYGTKWKTNKHRSGKGGATFIGEEKEEQQT